MKVVTKSGDLICETPDMERFGEALAAAGWEINGEIGCITKKITEGAVSFAGRTYREYERINVDFFNVYEARRMHYSVYKRDFPRCKTLNDYDASTKSITVLVPLEG